MQILGMFATKCATILPQNVHILWQTFQKFPCDNCDIVFNNFTHLKGHVKILLIDRERQKRRVQPIIFRHATIFAHFVANISKLSFI